jgi:hypothetical protein
MGASRLDLAAPSRWAQADLTTPPPQGFFSAPSGLLLRLRARGSERWPRSVGGSRLQARGSELWLRSVGGLLASPRLRALAPKRWGAACELAAPSISACEPAALSVGPEAFGVLLQARGSELWLRSVGGPLGSPRLRALAPKRRGPVCEPAAPSVGSEASGVETERQRQGNSPPSEPEASKCEHTLSPGRAMSRRRTRSSP